MGRRRNEVLAWVEGGALPAERLHDALRVARAIPNARDWQVFLERVLLGLGVALLAAGATYFIAANWGEFGRYARFALIQGALLVAVAVALWRGLARPAGQAALVAAVLFTGVLLALVGQAYQTGADTWELFAAWALAVLPWVAVGRMCVLWLVWIALVNMAVALYFVTFGRWFGVFGGAENWRMLCAGLFLLNAIALAVWEFAATRGASWLARRWAVRVVATACGVPVSVLAVLCIVDSAGGEAAWFGLYALWVLGVYAYYRHVRVDLFVLAGAVLSLIVVCTVGLARLLFNHGGAAGGLSLIALFVVVAAGAGAVWLRRVGAGKPG